MKKRIVYSALFLIATSATSCRNDIAPVTLSGEVAGAYQTNGFLDVNYIALPTSQLPTVQLRPKTGNQVTMLLSQPSSATAVQVVDNVLLTRQADESIKLEQNGKSIGSIQLDRVFDQKGMESQGRLIRLALPASKIQSGVSFTGYQQ